MRIPPPFVQPQNAQPQKELFPNNPLQDSSQSGRRAGGLGSNGAGGAGNLPGNAALSRAGVIGSTNIVSGPASPRFDADTTAKNILDLVNLQLREAVARGASTEELGELLQQAREGAQTGFAAAIRQLQGVGELDDALSSGISAALQKVDQAFTDIARQLGLDSATAGSNGSGTRQPVTLGELASGYNQRFATGQSADLTIKTADGDTVRLRIGAGTEQRADGSIRSAGGLTMEVDGELDADETRALNELVGRVGKLADSFFAGDMNAALQQAEAFEFNDPELSSLSLTLRRSVSTYQDVQSLGNDALADYGAIGNGGAQGAASTASSIKARLAEQLSALVPEASFAENPADTLKQLLAAQVAAREQQDNPLLDFANRLLDAMGASSTGTATGTLAAA